MATERAGGEMARPPVAGSSPLGSPRCAKLGSRRRGGFPDVKANATRVGGRAKPIPRHRNHRSANSLS